jgi:hypothetical protein
MHGDRARDVVEFRPVARAQHLEDEIFEQRERQSGLRDGPRRRVDVRPRAQGLDVGRDAVAGVQDLAYRLG